MTAKAVIVWIAGLMTFVPYAVYYLLFQAPRDQYAFLIASILFWIFGFWGVVSQVLMTLKIRHLLKTMESAGSGERLAEVLKGPAAKDVAIDLIATEHRLPRFVAAWIYTHALRRANGDC
jgi:hypothetical protein